MRGRRLPIALIIPALLIGLVALLATLQYRWLGQVSEAEREQLRRSLTQRASEFADDFDREISRAYLTLQLSRDTMATQKWDAFATAFERWRATARYPQMIKTIYLAESVGGRQTLRRFDPDARGFEDAPLAGWPSQLEPVRQQLALPFGSIRLLDSDRQPARAMPNPGSGAPFYAITMMAVNVDVPALLIPVSHAIADGTTSPATTADGSTSGAATWLQHQATYVLVELDGDYLRHTVLPTLAARHFPEDSSDQYRVAVVSSDGSSMLTRGVPNGVSIDVHHADVVTPFFGVRLDLAGGVVPSRNVDVAMARTALPDSSVIHALPGSRAQGAVSVIIQQGLAGAPGGQGGTTSGMTEVRIQRRFWRVVLQHNAGSLDAAVSQTRRSNLWLSFGILAVLSAGVVLVMVTAKRAEQLAVRQMDFVATVSHELRTPLAVIRSAAQNLSAGVISDPAQTRRYGDLIEGEGRRLTDMVEQVLDYAGLVGGRSLRPSQMVDVGALVDDVIASHGAAIRAAGFTVTVDTANGAGGVPPVQGDADALRRLLDNLVTNALKHGADGRWLGVTVRAGVTHGHREVEVAVSDRGRGIEAADLGHVFEPFYRGLHAVERQVQGNGLGLSLVKRIAEAHGGRISVKSVPGEGATFTVHLPAGDALSVDRPLGNPAPQPGAQT